MPKDFAVQGYKKKNKSGKTHIIIAVLTICIVVSFYFLKIKEKSKPKEIDKVQQTKIVEEAPVVETRPRFEFYTMLPENEESNNQETNNIKIGKYYLQVAEFKFQAEAKKLLKKLVAKKYDAKINKTVVNTTILYKVEIGPFKNNIEAKKIQQSLSQDKYRSTLKEIQE